MKKALLLISLCMISKTHAQPFSEGTNNTSSLCGPIPAVCYPTTISGGMGIGIYFVGLNQISNPSSIPPMLEDFTCTDSTWLDPGVGYTFEVQTGSVYEESVKAWIDFSNDGAFDPSEMVYHDSALIYMHQGTITIPLSASNTFTPIRMRVGSEYSGGTPLNTCNDAYYGQYEDYTIYYGANIGIREEEKRAVAFIPNPFHTTATFYAGSFLKDAVLKIYNLNGKQVSNFVISKQHSIISRDGLPDGMYFYELTTPDCKQPEYGKFILE